jgi:DNA invertase Pin-like site-specific DNA recombinase
MKVAIYARVSTDRGEQNPLVQVNALRAWLEGQGHTVGTVYVDHISGAKSARPQLKLLEADAINGKFDAVAIVKLDRLARSVKHLIKFAGFLEFHHVDLMVKDQAIDTSTPAGRLMFHMLSAIAEFELDLIRERTRDGLRHAAKNGTRSGRPIGRPRCSIPYPQARAAMIRSGGNKAAAARELGVPETTLRRVLARS